MKKEKILVFSLVGVFVIVLSTFLGVVFYSEFIYPQKFNQAFCSEDLVGQKLSALEIARHWRTSRVHKDQLYVRSPQNSDTKPIDTQMAAMMLEKSSFGGALWVGAQLGLISDQHCEVLVRDNEVQSINTNTR